MEVRQRQCVADFERQQSHLKESILCWTGSQCNVRQETGIERKEGGERKRSQLEGEGKKGRSGSGGEREGALHGRTNAFQSSIWSVHNVTLWCKNPLKWHFDNNLNFWGPCIPSPIADHGQIWHGRVDPWSNHQNHPRNISHNRVEANSKQWQKVTNCTSFLHDLPPDKWRDATPNMPALWCQYLLVHWEQWDA